MNCPILKFINQTIDHENGQPVNIKSMFIDSQLDSLGALIALMTIGTEYNIENEYVENVDVENLKIYDLVTLCKSSTTST